MPCAPLMSRCQLQLVPDGGWTPPNHIVVADHHWLVRATLVRILAGMVAGATITEVTNYLQLAAALKVAEVDHVLLDLIMPGLHNWRAELPALIAGMRPARVIVVSGLEDVDIIHRLVHAGIAGFIPKHYESRRLVNALRFILDGGTYIPTEAIFPSLKPPPSLEGGVPLIAELTQRQKDVLSLVGQGLPNKEIARHLVLSEATVKAHLNTIYRVLGVHNRTEAALVARTLM